MTRFFPSFSMTVGTLSNGSELSNDATNSRCVVTTDKPVKILPPEVMNDAGIFLYDSLNRVVASTVFYAANIVSHRLDLRH